jgi:hypothetical protein
MSDKPLAHRSPQILAPAVSTPPLPSSSGKWLGTRTTIMGHDATYVRAHADFLRARGEQSDAMRQLIESRLAVAKVMAKLATLQEIVEHEYGMGRAERQHERHLLGIQHEAEAVNAQIILAEAQARLATFAPYGQPPPREPPLPTGLSPDEVEELLHTIPELSPETLHTLSLLLKGRLKEKTG